MPRKIDVRTIAFYVLFKAMANIIFFLDASIDVREHILSVEEEEY